MPVWPSVNETKTPMMYSWMSTVRFAWKTIRMTDAASARITTPFEKIRRSPRVESDFGA